MPALELGSGSWRVLAWLVPLFALWAKIHIQFIDGLVVLGVAVIDSFTARWIPRSSSALKFPDALAALFISVLATFANPFGWHIYRVAYDLASQPGILDKIIELQAMHFRNWSGFCVLFLAMGAAAALAWQRRLQLFEVLLLLFAVQVSFRSNRDVWGNGSRRRYDPRLRGEAPVHRKFRPASRICSSADDGGRRNRASC